MPEEVYSKEMLADGRIVCFRFVSTGSEAAEKWYLELTDLFSNWDKRAPLLMLVDLSRENNLVSAEMMRTAREASHERPDVPGKTAVLIDGSEPSQNIKLLLDRGLAETRQRKIVASESEAVAWLLEP